jgi:hypothetical protein
VSRVREATGGGVLLWGCSCVSWWEGIKLLREGGRQQSKIPTKGTPSHKVAPVHGLLLSLTLFTKASLATS